MYEHYHQPRSARSSVPGPARHASRVHVRVSDAERAEVTNALCRHVADGRLDDAEFNDRMARTTAAKTLDDLARFWPICLSAPPVARQLGASALSWAVAGSHCGRDRRLVHHRRDKQHLPPAPTVVVLLIAALVIARHGRHGERRHFHR